MLNVEEIVGAAQAQTGLTDMGEPNIDEALAVLVDALNREANLRPDGVESQQAALIGRVMTRLLVNQIVTEHPEIRDEQIKGPIIIVGLPRTGTTKLHRMLAAHPDLQSLPLWRILAPAPLGPAPPGGEDPRIAIAEQVSAGMREHFPDFFAGHPMLPREVDEEVWMMDLAGRGWMPCYAAYVPSYGAWADTKDLRPWYAYLKQLLQQFQFEDGTQDKTWLLKAPEHIGTLDLLFETFPDATIVHTHRDPAVAITSLACLAVESRRMYSDEPQPLEAGPYILGSWAAKMQSYVDLRPGFEADHPFVDASYREVVDDAMAIVERTCTAAGLGLSDAARAAITGWEAANPQGKHGRHEYSMEEVGLDEQQIRGAFTDYRERFGGFLA